MKRALGDEKAEKDAEAQPAPIRVKKKRGDKGVVIWADGCFDMMHWGHCNSLRQAKKLGDYLIVGVHSDEEIRKNKGPPVMTEEERYAAVEACKWVDEVYRGAPFTTSLKLLDEEGVDFAAHGDDLVVAADGIDTYHEVKKAGRFKTYPRTKGVSTTDIVGRMLLMTSTHHQRLASDEDVKVALSNVNIKKARETTKVMGYLPSSRTFHLFGGHTEPKRTDKIGYVAGCFDLFHPGHISMLKQAKSLCDFLIVGVLDDQVSNEMKRGNWPVMNLHERVLSVLSCRYPDEVIIGCPKKITPDFLEFYNINFVFYGSVVDPSEKLSESRARFEEVPESCLRPLQSKLTITTSSIVSRIIENRAAYVKRNQSKEEREDKQEQKHH